MTVPSSGAFAQRFTNSSGNITGNTVRNPAPVSQMTLLREAAMNNIYDLAKSKGITVDEAVTRILANSSQSLVAYIIAKGEVPATDPTGMALQAALLRMNDVATTANVLNISDEDALQTIEASEQDEISQGMPQGDEVLPIPVQAALACVMQHASQSSGKTMGQIVKGVASLGKYYASGAGQNNDDGIVDISDPSNISDWLDTGISTSDPIASPTDSSGTSDYLSPISIGTSLATIPVSSGPSSIAAGIPTISNSASTLPQAGPDTSSGGVLNSITSIFTGIASAANAVRSAATSTTGAANSVRTAISNVGANSIATYIQQNSGMIVLFILIIAVVIIAVHAGNRK